MTPKIFNHLLSFFRKIFETLFALTSKIFCSDPQDAESDAQGWGNVNQAYDGEELQEPCEVGDRGESKRALRGSKI